MSTTIDQLAKIILNKDSLEQCSIQELQQLVEQYPYFGPAHLLLTEKFKTENSSDYKAQLQKTQLYFNNPLWLDQLLNHKGNAEIIEVTVTEKIEKAESLLEPEIEIAPVEEMKTDASPIDNDTTSKEETPVGQGSELTFEPFHTVDYFASQGIKFKEEEKPSDRFGQQLKSFTDWLKSMKRLPEASKPEEPGSDGETNVVQLAEYSVEDRDVVTEAMAEVWKKQGNMEKAIEIYGKLSLHNPSKRAYFAAKIEQLKKTN